MFDWQWTQCRYKDVGIVSAYSGPLALAARMHIRVKVHAFLFQELGTPPNPYVITRRLGAYSRLPVSLFVCTALQQHQTPRVPVLTCQTLTGGQEAAP